MITDIYQNESLLRTHNLLSAYFTDDNCMPILSIDNIAFTVPVPLGEVALLNRIKAMYFDSEMIEVLPLTSKEAGEQKYKQQTIINFHNGASMSIFCYGIDGKEGSRTARRMNQVKIEFNPNMVGHANVRAILTLIQQIFGESYYRELILRAKVTSIHYAWDIPGVPIEHVLAYYSYSAMFEAFFDDQTGELEGFRFGNKKGCPIIFYCKAREQGGLYKGHNRYLRIEKQHRPQQVGAKGPFTIATMEQQNYSFQGVSICSPIMLGNMPESIREKVHNFGIDKTSDLLSSEKNRNKLRGLKENESFKRHEAFKQTFCTGYHEKLYELKQLLLLDL